MSARRLVAMVLAAGLVMACSELNPDDRFYVDAPSESQFAPVAAFLVHRCGSIDCHGQLPRNLRLYGEYGLRLSKNDTPAGSPTTAAEIKDDYLSVIGLEPESLTQVVDDGGAGAESLTLLAKPMGRQEHKGGTLIKQGDPQYECLMSWLGGSVDRTACKQALKEP